MRRGHVTQVSFLFLLCLLLFGPSLLLCFFLFFVFLEVSGGIVCDEEGGGLRCFVGWLGGGCVVGGGVGLGGGGEDILRLRKCIDHLCVFVCV